jgi:hypothetical protein
MNYTTIWLQWNVDITDRWKYSYKHSKTSPETRIQNDIHKGLDVFLPLPFTMLNGVYEPLGRATKGEISIQAERLRLEFREDVL